jgi:hypothetical protein
VKRFKLLSIFALALASFGVTKPVIPAGGDTFAVAASGHTNVIPAGGDTVIPAGGDTIVG